ncbi:MAG TPA: acetyl ornithine aminotransferase family protein [Blastocatellia bacterium]|nr:acetyl ornithine aminotransferase family protein [Blastocatellia bacterium]
MLSMIEADTTRLAETKLPDIRTPLPGPKAQEIIARDTQYISPSYTRGYPLVMQRGRGAMIEDVDGNIFLDFNAGVAVCSTGHAHPDVIAAIKQQVDEFIHISGTDYYYPHLPALAEKLNRLAPGTVERKAHFGNSGAEAVEGAIKLAMYATRRPKLIGFFGAFHGRTMGALSLTGSKARQRAGFGAQALDVTHTPYANCYRCPYRLTPESCGAFESKGPHCARVIEDLLFKTTVPADECAAIIVEPIQGEGGYVVPPASFLHTIREIADRHGIVVIADEVQSGMGRTGRMFASEHFDFVPDIMSLAKGIASGLPLGATLARADLMTWPPGAHASTFGGNPVAIAASLVTIELLEDHLIANAARMGEYLLNGLRELMNKHQLIGDVRGKGLMIGIELVKDRVTKEPAVEERDRMEVECFRRGLIIQGCGTSTIRLSPPLVIDRDQCDFALRTLDEAFTAIAA